MGEKLFKSEDIKKISFLSSLNIHPKDKKFVFVKTNMVKNDYKSHIYLSSFSGKIKKYAKGKNPLWSPDGKLLLFVDKKDKDFKGQELYLIPYDGGEPYLLTKIKNGSYSNIKWSDNSKGIYAIKKVEEENDSDVREIESLPVWQNGGSFIERFKYSLVYTTINGKEKEIKPPKDNFEPIFISLYKNKLTVITRKNRINYPAETEIYIYDLNKKQWKEISLSFKKVYWLEWVDDKHFVFLGHDGKYGLNTNMHLYYYINKNKIIDLFGDLDLSFGNSLNCDVRFGSTRKIKLIDNTIYFVVTEKEKAPLYKVTVDGKLEKVLSESSCEDFDIIDDNLIYINQDFLNLPEVYSYNKNKKLTKFNDKIIKNYTIKPPYYLNAKSEDKKDLDVWYLPPYTKENKGTILEIHGGPKTAYGDSFMFEFHLLASNGYGVIFTNPHGSEGYGNNFADIRGKYGTIDYRDLMKAVDAVVEKFDLDKNKLGVTGGSYGGYMTNWIVTQTDKFKAAVTQRSISNWFSMYGTTDIGYYFVTDQIGSHPWENKEKYIESSPLFHVDKAKTPLLLIHSLKDYRCWVPEALQFYTALKVRGIKTKLALFPNETHELSRSGKPDHRIKRYNLIIEWFNENIK